MHKLLPALTILLWIANVAVVAIEHLVWPQIDEYDTGQRLLLGITITITIAWLLHKRGIEYKIGYRQGRQDRSK
ncbi:hypothetical protein ACIBG7_15025 [Nonomuraea sp. NPDC050328]|uniref:hypothetical protein n=1 Tax=Nonomuraea sp. NPDC050328 TaxID=3364361 RepID=UPI0037908C55